MQRIEQEEIPEVAKSEGWRESGAFFSWAPSSAKTVEITHPDSERRISFDLTRMSITPNAIAADI